MSKTRSIAYQPTFCSSVSSRILSSTARTRPSRSRKTFSRSPAAPHERPRPGRQLSRSAGKARHEARDGSSRTGWKRQFVTSRSALPPSKLCTSPKSTRTTQPASNGAGIVETEEEYERVRETLFSDACIDGAVKTALAWREGHERGDYAQWLTLEGFFWFPRTLFGIENHLYAFYDEPELMHRMNRDLTDFHLRALERLLPVYRPEFMTFAEDMSYNLGPMIGKEQFDEFLLPYYRELVPVLREAGVRVLIDTDGNVEPLIPWFREAGIEGVLPLERQAGVDVNRIRRNHPD